MKVLSLRLKGFIGLRDGSGIEEIDIDLSTLPTGLIAITGSNGSGKTTFLDNLHPYRIMPYKLRDRKEWSPGSFSYYDQCYGRDALKELIFEMNGKTYRAQILIDAEKKKTDAYLSVAGKEGDLWQPLNDGKTKTFDAALEEVVGSPRLFFSSAFRAQGARSLSSYSRGDIISIVSELLVIDHIKDQSDKAGEICKWISGQIVTMNGKVDILNNEIFEEDRLLDRQKIITTNITTSETAMAEDKKLLTSIGEKIVSLKKRQATRESDEATETEATKLLTSLTDALGSEEKALDNERNKDVSARDKMIKDFQERISEIVEQKNSLLTNYTQRNSGHEKEIGDLELKLKDLVAINDRREEITNASTRLKELEEKQAEIENDLSGKRTDLEDSRKKVEQLVALETELETKKHYRQIDLDKIQSSINDAEFISSGLKDLDCRADSTNWINEACPLLKNAVAAKDSLVGLRKEHEDLTADTSAIDAIAKDIDGLRPHREAGLTLFSEIKTLETNKTGCEEEIKTTKETAALIHDLGHATERKKEIGGSIAILKEKVSVAKTKFDEDSKELDGKITAEETKRDKALETSTNEWLTYREKQSKVIEECQKKVGAQKETCERLKLSLAEDLSVSINANGKEKETIEARRSETEKGLKELSNDKAIIVSKLKSIEIAKNNRGTIKASISSYEAEEMSWSVLRQACSNNGIIALEIDDAGPSIAALANKLLASCYGTRFSVRIETQGVKADGTLKEDFDITVFDSENGMDKSIKNMSGGEVTWIEDAITKAICLYRMERSDRVFDTIFTDEKDGSLDEQKKNEFFAIKKQMLAIGHHKQEFFISQTPELQEQADARIKIGSGKIEIQAA